MGIIIVSQASRSSSTRSQCGETHAPFGDIYQSQNRALKPFAHSTQYSPPRGPKSPPMQIGWNGACCMCWLKCHTIYYTFGMTNARRTHRSAVLGPESSELGSNKSRAPEALGEPGNAPGATRLKLVKNCSNFPLVKQMSQGNMPPAIAASEAAPPLYPYPFPRPP